MTTKAAGSGDGARISWDIGGFSDHGTVVILRLKRPGGARRTVSGDGRPMRELIRAWIDAGRPRVEVIDDDDGPAIRLLVEGE